MTILAAQSNILFSILGRLMVMSDLASTCSVELDRLNIPTSTMNLF
jgi:hypothetical protein